MIIRLSTPQVSDHWEAIKNMINRSLPDIQGQLVNRDNNILRSLLIGDITCWVGYKSTVNSQNEIVGMMLTRILFDDITGIKNLFIYCLAGWDTISIDFYQEGLKTLEAFGKESKCNRITFYSEEPAILRITKTLGFNTDMVYGRLQI